MFAASHLPTMTVHPFGTIEGETARRPLPGLRGLSPMWRMTLPALCVLAGLAGMAGAALVALG